MKAMYRAVWRRLLLPYLATVGLALHDTFGRAHGRALCRRWASEIRPSDPASLMTARMALEHPSSFVVAEFDEGLVAFICAPAGSNAHRVDAVIWTDGANQPSKLQELRRWHANHFPEQRLAAGALSHEEIRAWDETTPL